MLSPNDSFGGKSCEGDDRVTIGACSRPAVEAGAAVAVTGILRLQLMAAWYPPAFGSPGLWASSRRWDSSSDSEGSGRGRAGPVPAIAPAWV